MAQMRPAVKSPYYRDREGSSKHILPAYARGRSRSSMIDWAIMHAHPCGGKEGADVQGLGRRRSS